VRFPLRRCEVAARSFFPSWTKSEFLASAIVFLILGRSVYLQYRHWQSFDWGTFWAQTHRIRKIHVLHAIALIYFAYFLRAVRWKEFF